MTQGERGGRGGMMAGNGFYNAYSVVTLNALIGNLNCKGGFVMNGGAFRMPVPARATTSRLSPARSSHRECPGRNRRTTLGRICPAQGRGQAYPARDVVPNCQGGHRWLTAALRVSLRAQALICGAATRCTYRVCARWSKDLADPKRLPLIVSVDPLINESNAFADYIVPDSIMYESWGWTAPWGGIPTKASTARWPVVEPRATKTADGQPVGMETFYIALATAMKLPGFGADAIADMEGNRYPLQRPEDWYLRGGANIAFAGKAPVQIHVLIPGQCRIEFLDDH